MLTTIRCNYTYENLDSFVDLINDFKEFNDYTNLRFSFHKVWQEPESIELQAKRTEIKKIVAEIGVKSNINSFFGDSILPCYSDFDNSVVINYNGDIYKCTARDFLPKNRIGYLNDIGHIIYNEKASTRMQRMLTNDCYSCKMLPICTICFQQRSESKNRLCPNPAIKNNAKENIAKYFLDLNLI